MANIVKELAKKIGIDKSIAYSSGARIIGGFTGVASVFFITTFLTGVEQGFFYTFGSLLAMQVFFELGLTSIMTQFAAHEASCLQLTDDGHYSGDPFFVSRLASLVRFCIKWYAILALLVVSFLLIVGFLYFKRFGETQSTDVEWRLPWIIISIATGIKLYEGPLTSILSGLGYVKEMSIITFGQQIIIPVFTWIGLAVGLKLYVVGLGYLVSVIVWLTFVIRQGLLRIIINLWNEKIENRVSYMKEIFPLQWRISLSWISGYFIFNIFNIVLFVVEGAVVAGQMGMTLQALNAIQTLSFSWIGTKVPLYSKLIALKDYVQLDKLFKKTLRQMTSVCAVLLFLFLLFIFFLRITELKINGNVFADRFLDYIPLLLMIIPVYTHQYVNSWATYLRCHKKEPFLINSVVAGGLCMISTLGFGHLYGLYGVTIGYCIIQILMFPWGYYTYYSYKQKWHNGK